MATAVATPARRAGRFAVPRQRRSLAPRSRLLARLHAGIGNGLMVVRAPAGYGKTALLAAFAAEIDYNVRWLTLDASGRSPEVLAAQIAAALLDDEDPPDLPHALRADDLRAYLASAVNRACEVSERPILLVFDNSHELVAAEGAVELLDWLLETLPEGVEVIVSSREAPLLSAVDRRVAGGDSVLLGSVDLAFDEEEIAALAADRGSSIAPGAVFAATRGWPVGVMAVLTGTVSLAQGARPRAGQSWERYLINEVWRAVPAELQRLLLPLSLLPAVTPEAAGTLIGASGWRSLRTWLEPRDFLFELLEDNEVRLNPLFRQFLSAEYERTAPEAFASTAREVATRLEGEGRLAEAIELARSAGQAGVVAGLLERHSDRLIYQGAYALLWRGYEVVPAEALAERPIVQGIRARVLAHIGRPEEALTAATEVMRGRAHRGARVHAILARIRAYRLLGRYDDLQAVFIDVRAMRDRCEPAIAAELAYHEADFALTVTRDLALAERLLQETIERCEAAKVQPLDLVARSSLGQLYTIRGDGPAAVTALTAAAQGWRAWGSSANLNWVLNNLGMAHLMVADFESAVTVLEEAKRQGLSCGNRRNAAYAIASLGDAELALGRFPRAREHYDEALRLCSEDVHDESLVALAIAGLSAAILGSGNVQQADFFSQRAMLVAHRLGNPYELAMCRLQEASVRSSADNHAGAIESGREAVGLFESIDARASLRLAYYRLALSCFRANRRNDAQQALRKLDGLITEPWMAGVLLPEVRQQPMFAQWAASRGMAGQAFREMLERQPFAPANPVNEAVPSRLPRVVAHSLGQVGVSVGGRDVTDQDWASLRAKELFFLFLENRGGLRKEAAVEHLYPELPLEKCNSAFHSNLYRIRRALFKDSVVKLHGSYVLSPQGEFEWDVEQFEAALGRAAGLPAGSAERARQYEAALALYGGPFAEEFYSEWAESLRRRLEERADEAVATLAGYYAGQGEFESAATCMERLLERDRYNEEAAYQLATYRLRAGQPVAALGFIDDYVRAYEAEFEARLPGRFQELRSRIAAGR